ncbi:MAG TPA: PAS domain S-box protein [Fodinibius sp.]|nr:PAS domain S-box protein [Fodinibius sp.]
MTKASSSYLADAPIFIIDRQSLDILDVNQQAIDFYGYSYQRLCSMNIGDLGRPKSEKGIVSGIKENDQELDCIWEHQNKDGEMVNIRFTHHIINFRKGEAIFAVVHEDRKQVMERASPSSLNKSKEASEGRPAIVGTILDLTEDNVMSKRYQASVESFRDLFNSISDAICILDKEACFLTVNGGAMKMFGYDYDEFIGKKPAFLTADDQITPEQTKKIIRKSLKGTTQHFKGWLRRKKGGVFPAELVVNPCNYMGEEAVTVVIRDVSEQHEVEEELRKSKEKFRQLYQNAPIGIALMDKNKRVKQVNKAFTNIFGYDANQLSGKNIDNIIVPDGEEWKAYELSEAVFSGQTGQAVSKREDKNGCIIDTLIYGVPVIVEDETIAIYGLYVDITDRIEAEEKVKESLREKEVLLSEIHHRVKNNLAVISGLLELQAYSTDSRPAVDALKESQMRINTIAIIHEKLYQHEDLAAIAFDSYLKELTGVIVGSLHEGSTEIDIDIDADPIELTINQAIPCGLILNELLTNAYKHAFSDSRKGNITVLLQRNGTTVTLSVYDDGSGRASDLNAEENDSLGVQLIQTLSAQLGGTPQYRDREPGIEFELTFDLEEA